MICCVICDLRLAPASSLDSWFLGELFFFFSMIHESRIAFLFRGFLSSEKFGCFASVVRSVLIGHDWWWFAYDAEFKITLQIAGEFVCLVVCFLFFCFFVLCFLFVFGVSLLF